MIVENDLKVIGRFYPISTVKVLQGIPDQDGATVLMHFEAWLKSFERRSMLYTNVRSHLYDDYLWRTFCDRYDMDWRYAAIDNEHTDRQWNSFCESFGANAYEFQRDEYLGVLEAMCNIQKTSTRELLDFLPSEVLLSVDTFYITDSQSTIEQRIDALWFNSHIQTASEEIKELKALPYEQYLKSNHWMRVRRAMLMLNQCKCQGKDCNLIGESCYGGDENMMHVHHLTYQNRGNERFEDLKLLCNKCHKQVHGIAS